MALVIKNRLHNVQDERDIVIAVMGVTGAGKSSFIRQMTGKNVLVGDGLEACTQSVRSFSFSHRGVTVTLLDSPGFNDTYRTNTDILDDISTYLSKTYALGLKLSGIIYLHPISHPRMEGSSLLSLRMFRKLVGDDGLANVILATTHWGRVSDEEGDRREKDLKAKFWAPFLDEGARMDRYYADNMESGLRLLDALINKDRIVLDIQREIVDEGKQLIETAAGYALNEELVQVTKTYEARLHRTKQELREIMDRALKDQSEKSMRDLAEVRHHASQLEGQIEATREQQRKLKEKERLAARDVQQMVQQIEKIEMQHQKQTKEWEQERQDWKEEKAALGAQDQPASFELGEYLPVIGAVVLTAAKIFMYLNGVGW